MDSDDLPPLDENPPMIAWLFSLAWAECVVGPTDNATLQRQVESALFAFVELDDAGFEAWRGQAIQTVFCLDERIRPHLAAEFLRLEGIHAFTTNNEPFASAAFRAARTLEPNHRLPTTLAPPGGPLFNLYAASVNLPVVPWELPQGAFRSYVNGVASITAPNGVSVVQLQDTAGAWPFSGVVTRREDLPAALIEQLQAQGPLVDPFRPPPGETASARNSNRGTVAMVAFTMALAGGALYGSAAMSRVRYDAAPTKQRRQTTNLLFIGSIGGGVMAGGLGIAAIAMPRKRAP